jgi:predicted HTH transcriptional regulator
MLTPMNEFKIGQVVGHENEVTEYKAWNLSSMDWGSDKYQELKEIVKKTACSFANTNGGIIYFGITDDKKIRGIFSSDNPGDKINAFISTALSEVFPQIIRFTMKLVPVKDAHDRYTNMVVAAVVIYPIEDDLIYVSTDLKFTNLFKRGKGTTIPISPYELENKVKQLVQRAVAYEQKANLEKLKEELDKKEKEIAFLKEKIQELENKCTGVKEESTQVLDSTIKIDCKVRKKRGRPINDDFESTMKGWLNERKSRGVKTTVSELQKKAKEINLSNFKCSVGWAQKFLKRHFQIV